MRHCFTVCVSILLVSCGGDQGAPDESVTSDTMSDSDAAIAAEYQKKVSAKVSNSMVNSLASDLDITEDQARCLLAIGDLARVEIDPEVQERVRECDVDPAALK